MKAYDIANELDNTLGEAFAHIDNFKPDRSVMDIGETYGNWFKQVKTSHEAGFIADPAAISIYKEVFGSKAYGQLMQWSEWATSQAAGNMSPEEYSKAYN